MDEENRSYDMALNGIEVSKSTAFGHGLLINCLNLEFHIRMVCQVRFIL